MSEFEKEMDAGTGIVLNKATLENELAVMEQQKENLRNSFFQAEGACQALRQLIALVSEEASIEPEKADADPNAG